MSACCATGQNSQQLFEVVWSGQDVRSMRVIHLLTTQSIIMDKNNHEFMHSSFIVHSRRIMSCHVQLPRISQQSICTMQQQTLCSMPTISSTQPWTIFLQAGTQWRACSACSRGQDSGQRPSSASTSCKPRCLLLAARLQQTRLIEPTLYPNFVVRGLHRTHAGHSQSLNIGCELIAINCVVDGRNKECTSRRTQLGTHRCARLSCRNTWSP